MGTRPTYAMIQALALAAKGVPPERVAKRYKVHVTSLRRAMHREGIKVAKPGRPRKKKL